MKRFVFTLVFLFSFCCVQAQWTLRSYVDYEYTRTEGSGGALAVFGDYQLNEYFTAGLGLKGKIGYPLAINLYWQADLLHAKSGTLYLENRYLYRLFPNLNLQEFNGLLDFGWENRHFNFQLGLCNRYIAEIPLRKDGILVSDNVLQDGDIIESKYAITRRNRTIHTRMRDYLYELKHNDQLTTAIMPVGDGITVSYKKA